MESAELVKKQILSQAGNIVLSAAFRNKNAVFFTVKKFHLISDTIVPQQASAKCPNKIINNLDEFKLLSAKLLPDRSVQIIWKNNQKVIASFNFIFLLIAILS